MKKIFVSLLAVLLIFSLSGISMAKKFAGKKVLFIDSYHEGYAWSDGITNSVKRSLDGSGVELKIIRMDTKRNKDKEFKKNAAQKAKSIIEQYNPDVVIAADDNASKYLIVPFYKDASLPFVFCGVNWDASGYGFPTKNVTGMVEVAPVPQLFDLLKAYARGDQIGFLAPDLLTAKKDAKNYGKAIGVKLTAYFAKDFEDYKKGFLKLQDQVDVLLLGSDGGLYKDHADEMKAFIEANSKIPSGSTHDFMADYALVGFAKLAEEQGDWAAETALKILGGASPDSIPVTKNEKGKLIINTRIAKNLGVEIPFEILESADQIIE
jgi:ABC-type uncharacterized transport system substrate-binding protein